MLPRSLINRFVLCCRCALPLVPLLATGSIKFPEENNRSVDPDQATVLVQSVAGLSPIFSGDGALFVLARLPLDKRVNNLHMALLGNSGASGGNKIRFGLYGTTAGVSANRNRIYSLLEGSGLTTPVIDEDAFLLVIYRSGSSKGLDWYSLKDGTKHAGTPAGGASVVYLSSEGPNLMVGGMGSGTPSLGGTAAWPGEIAGVGYVDGAISDATWSAIALGRDVVDALGAANLKWYRQFDHTTGSLAAPPQATADVTSPMTLWGAATRKGSDFVRQSENAYLLIDGLSDGWVYGLTVGETTRDITISGTGAGLAGDVEVRVINAATQSVVVDWTAVGGLTNGVWSGVVTVPKGGWYTVDARSDTLTAHRADEFGVGWKIVQLGQSQTSIYLSSGAKFDALNPEYDYEASYLSNDTGKMSLYRIGAFPQHGGLAYFVNQFRHFDADTPLMIIDEAVNGTSQVDLVNDSITGRDWAPFQDKLDQYGNDVSVVVKNWGTSDMNVSAYDEVLDALVKGTGPRAGEHSLDAALQNGYRFAVSPLSRHTGGDAYVNNAKRARKLEVDWAFAEGYTVGPPHSDFFIEAGGGPHQAGGELMGNYAFGARQAVTVARALGLDASTNPGFTGLAVIQDDFIRLDVDLPNGGDLYSPTPNALRSFEVNEGTGWQSTGFTARIERNTIRIQRDSGEWAPGTQVRYLSNLENRIDGDAAAEAAIIGSALYETWPSDVLGLGLPLLGKTTGGHWSTDFSVTGQAGTTVFTERFDDWAFTDHALTGNEADPAFDVDFDGDSNLLEFALGSHPHRGQNSGRWGSGVVNISGEDRLYLTIPVRAGAVFSGSPALQASIDGIRYRIEGSADLLHFDLAVLEAPSTFNHGLETPLPGWEHRSFSISSTAMPAFIRVHVDQP